MATVSASPAATSTVPSSVGGESDMTSTITIVIIAVVLSTLLIIIGVLVMVLVRKPEIRGRVISSLSRRRGNRPRKQPPPGVGDDRNGRRLAAMATLPYEPPQPVTRDNGGAAHSNYSNRGTAVSRDTYDGTYANNLTAPEPVAPTRRQSLMMRPSIEPVQNEAYEDIIAVSVPHIGRSPLDGYENVIIPLGKQPAAREPSRESQYSTYSEDAHLLASRQPSAAPPLLMPIQGSGSETMSLVDDSAYATPEELMAVIRKHATAYENLGVSGAPLKQADTKPPVAQRTSNLLKATPSNAPLLPHVDHISADDCYDNRELCAAGPRAADLDLTEDQALSLDNHYHDIAVVEGAGQRRAPDVPARSVAMERRQVASRNGAAVSHPQNGYEDVDLPRRPEVTERTHRTYERLTSKQYRDIPTKEIQRVRLVGRGSFGEVWKGKWTRPDSQAAPVAIKSLHSKSSDSLAKEKLLGEASVLGRFRHPNVVQLHGVTETKGQSQLVLEWVERGCLLAWLRNTRPGQDGSPADIAKQLLVFCRHIAQGLQYLQKTNFIHRDLAARNILLGEDYTCKISDFGMSKILSDDSYYTCHGGKLPVKWSPPEVILKRKFSLASDIWSYGVVLYEIWSLGRKPYFPTAAVKVAEDVCAGYRLPCPPGCPLDMYRVMVDCWNSNCMQRPTAAQLCHQLGMVAVDEHHGDVELLGSPHDIIQLADEFTALQTRYQKPQLKPRLGQR